MKELPRPPVRLPRTTTVPWTASVSLDVLSTTTTGSPKGLNRPPHPPTPRPPPGKDPRNDRVDIDSHQVHRRVSQNLGLRTSTSPGGTRSLHYHPSSLLDLDPQRGSPGVPDTGPCTPQGLTNVRTTLCLDTPTGDGLLVCLTVPYTGGRDSYSKEVRAVGRRLRSGSVARSAGAPGSHTGPTCGWTQEPTPWSLRLLTPVLRH